MSIGRPHLIINSLLIFAVFSAAFLNSSVFADDSAIENVSVNVPVSCTMNGTGMTSHTASIPNGTYQADIGTTTLQSFCNDSQGFAIYAIGYTNEEYGNTNLIGATQNQTIVTGTATTTGSPDVSNWAVKLATDSTATYPITLDNSFGAYSTVPTTYTKVAHRDSGTDLGSSATGSTLTTTYAAYISKTQAADTYNGKVKYTLVHPAAGPEPVYENQYGIIFDGNGSTFSGGATKNRVVYEKNCVPTYVGTTPMISKTPNVYNDGTATSGYQYNYTQRDPVSFDGATRLRVEISYGVEYNFDFVYVFEGNYDGAITDNMEAGQLKTYSGYADGFAPGASDTFYVDGDTVTFAFFADDYADAGYYGYYARVYPIYSTEHSGTVIEEVCELNTTPVSGAYATTVNWNGSWYADVNGASYNFTNENEILNFIEENDSVLVGSSIILYRAYLFNEALVKAGVSQSGGYYVMQELDHSVCKTVALEQNNTFIDIRDNNTYLVSKLKDGNCWMLDNLRLDPINPVTASNINSNNTNAPSAAIDNYLNGGSSTSGWANVAVVNKTSNWSATNPNNGYTNPYVNNNYIDTLKTNYGIGSGKVGVYYNFCAATVGTYCYDGSSGVDIQDTIIDAPYDICPSSWRLPTGGETGEQNALFDKYNIEDAVDTGSLQYNLSTPLSSSFSGNNPSSNPFGSWPSSTYGGSSAMYSLVVRSDTVDAVNETSWRFTGYPVRCVVAR